MKIRMTFKDPDGVYESIKEESVRSVRAITPPLDEDEVEELIEARIEKIKENLTPWIEYNEYLSVEFDLDAGTAIVVKRK